MHLFLKICNYYAFLQKKFLNKTIIYVIIHVNHAELLLFLIAYFECAYNLSKNFKYDSDLDKRKQ